MKRALTFSDLRLWVLSAFRTDFESFTWIVLRAVEVIVRLTVPIVSCLRWSAFGDLPWRS